MTDAGQEVVGTALLAGLLILRVVLAVHALITGARRGRGGSQAGVPGRAPRAPGRSRRRNH